MDLPLKWMALKLSLPEPHHRGSRGSSLSPPPLFILALYMLCTAPIRMAVLMKRVEDCVKGLVWSKLVISPAFFRGSPLHNPGSDERSEVNQRG